MHFLFTKFPITSRFVLAILLGVLALAAANLIDKTLLSSVRFPLTSTVLLMIATLLLYKIDPAELPPIGLNWSLRHLWFIIFGLILGMAGVVISKWLQSLYTGEVWHMASAPDASQLFRSLYLILPMAAVQELMFRGYLFTKTIVVRNVRTANLLFAVIFMLVHVLDRDVLQKPGLIVALAISIPFGHLLFATALLKTRTLYFPIGLHWGNNWATQHLNGNSDSPDVLLFTTNQIIIDSWPPHLFMIFIFNSFFLFLTWCIYKFVK